MSVKVSIIIPVYNVEEYISYCFDTIKAQTLTDIEIICVDDGSTDNSVDVINKYVAEDPRFKIYRQENRGAGVARNVGIKAAKGEFIAFMDPDDYYPDENVLADLYEGAKANNTLIAGGSVQFLKNGEITLGELSGVKYYFEKDSVVNYIDIQQDYYYQRFIYNREMLVKNNILFPYYRRYQDPPFTVRAMLKAGKLYTMVRPTYTYRVGASGGFWTEEKIYDRLEGFIDELEITRDAGLGLLHSRIVPRLKMTFDEAVKDTLNLKWTNRFNDVMLRLRNAVDVETALKFNKRINVDYLDDYISEAFNTDDDSAKPDVTVVVPVYNVEKYLEVCLDSVLSQSLQNIEVICVNDGSKDNSLSIIKKYVRNDKRVKLIDKQNEGLSAARNDGLKKAKGKYILFIDSDDYIAEGTLETLFNKSEKNTLDILQFSAGVFYETEEAKKMLYKEDDAYVRTKFLDTVMTGSELLPLQVNNKQYYSLAQLMFLNVNFMRENSLEFFPKVLHEDEIFNPIAMSMAKRVMLITDKLYIRRIREDSIMTSNISHRNFVGYFVAYVELMSRYIASNRTDEGLLMRAKTMHMITENRYKRISEEEREKIKAALPHPYDFIFERCGYNLKDIVGRNKKNEETYRTDIAELNKKLIEKERKNSELSAQLKDVKKQNERYKYDLNEMKNSVSFRIGRKITWLPRKIRGGIRCYKENGLAYTIKRFFQKIKNKLK